MPKILIIDDDDLILSMREILFKSAGFEVKTLEQANNVVQEVREFEPDLVITDIMMPGVSGGMVVSALRHHFDVSLPVIVSSASKIKVRGRSDAHLHQIPKSEEESTLLSKAQELLGMKEE